MKISNNFGNPSITNKYQALIERTIRIFYIKYLIVILMLFSKYKAYTNKNINSLFFLLFFEYLKLY